MSLYNYHCDEIKRIIDEVSPNYPQLTTYTSEWLYFYENEYNPGTPVDLEYQKILVNPTGTVQNAIPYSYKSAILKGNTKYRDIDTGDILDTFDETKNLELVSVKMPVLTTTGKNLFDKNRVVPGRLDNGQLGHTTDSTVSIFDDGFEVVSMSKYRGCVVEKIKINGSSDYYFSYNINPITDGFSVIFHFLDKDYNYISKATAYTGADNVISSPSNASYVSAWFNTNKTIDTPITLQNIQFEEDNNATEYEPFKSNILTVNEDITLRSNGDVYDELNLLTGRLTQRIDENNEVLAQEVVKTVDLTKLNKPYEGTNHYHLTANIPCEAILEVPVVSTGAQTLSEINDY